MVKQLSSESSPKRVKPLMAASMRVGLGDVDGARLVYFAAPATWSERLMSEWMAVNGHPLGELFESGVALPVASTTSTFKSPLRQDEMVNLELRVSRIGDKSFTVVTDVLRPGDPDPAIVVETTHVYAEQRGTVVGTKTMPDWLRADLEPDATAHRGES